MSGEDLQRQTSINIQEKANLIWAIADKLVGLYKPHEYGKVILPMCVIKRFEDTLAPTKDAVIKMNEELEAKGIAVKKGFLEAAAKQKLLQRNQEDGRQQPSLPRYQGVLFSQSLSRSRCGFGCRYGLYL